MPWGEGVDTAAEHFKAFEDQLKTPLNISSEVPTRELTHAEIQNTCAACVADNVGYMRDAIDMVEAKYPKVFGLGCTGPVGDLICEDLSKLPELNAVITACEKIVLECKKNKKKFAELQANFKVTAALSTIPTSSGGQSRCVCESFNVCVQHNRWGLLCRLRARAGLRQVVHVAHRDWRAIGEPVQHACECQPRWVVCDRCRYYVCRVMESSVSPGD